MLNLNYYCVDVGDNFCLVSKHNYLISIREALFRRNTNQLRLAWEFIVHSIKEKSVLSSQNEFKMVFVNKAGKYAVFTKLEGIGDKVQIEPLVLSNRYNVYMMIPGQRLDIRCKVTENHIEHRYLFYEDIVATVKS